MTVTFDNGTPITDDTNIQLSTSDVQVAPISRLDDPETTDINEFTTLFGSVGSDSAGGTGTFFIHAVAPGTVTLTASAVDPQTGRTSRATFNYTITQGPEPFERLEVEAVQQSLPANVFDLTPQQAFRTVYNTEAEISFRDPLGNFVSPGATGDQSTVEVSINPLSVAAFSTLDDPTTEEINEIFVTLGSAPVDMVAGKGKIFIWPRDPGIATITVNAFDQFTGETIATQYDIEVVSGGSTDLPTSIRLVGSGANYINGSGGAQSQVVQVFVDASDVPVGNPNGFNNVMVDINTDGPNSGEKISGVNAQGQNVQGSSINIPTNNGVASLQLLSGNSANTVIMTTTTDRADNNVDNGLQDPITAQRSFAISDGILFGLDITIPNLNNLFINNVSDQVSTETGLGNLDGTYTMTISAIGTDKGGNPALPQQIQFGLIDSPIVGFPQDGPGTFVISGTDGDPQEGGSLFTSVGGEFQTAGGGAQPGDTLLVFGEEILGNEDLESAVTVQSVNSQTSITIAEDFNRNDLTGTIVNDLGIFPYIVGRAVDGNILATANIDDNGVASTEINYPVSKLGKIAGIYAKGQGVTVNNVTRSVTDSELILYPGIASIPSAGLNAFITVAPSVIPANMETAVTVCVYDAAQHPIQGANIQWAFLGTGNGFIDGVLGSGIMDNRSGADGCATGIANPTGIITSGTDTGYVFNVGNITCQTDNDNVCIQVADPGAIYLSATPAFHNNSGVKIIDLFLFGGNGQGIPNVPLFVSCQSSGGELRVQVEPGATDENGMTTSNIFAALDGINESFSGTCDFTTGEGSPTATVTFNGIDLCTLNTSPLPPGCGP
ncbi:hypothetical protein ACFODZ_06215 [Marinicella sediminis]|uniref:Uncharacterized protein n=1 Tax=Marinicella sediminis TaxID=1792834 RepID=A0ABV7JAA6_9GAMM|nr:hypothetical protein [Marinicella sediminis]